MGYEETRPPGLIYGTGRTGYRDTLADLHRTDHDVEVHENNRRPHETTVSELWRYGETPAYYGAIDPINFNYRPNTVSIKVRQQRRLRCLSWFITCVLEANRIGTVMV